MRICILTYRLHSNIGFLLQAYALQKTLIRLGHSVQTAALYDRRISGVMRLLLYCKRLLIYLLCGGKNKAFFLYCPTEKEQAYIDRNTHAFIERNLVLTPVKMHSAKELRSLNRYDFDAYVVGSDQVWRRDYARGHIDSFFLNFLPPDDRKTIRLSYAASFGKDEMDYTAKELETCRKALKKFKAVSVREASGINLCRDYFQADACQVLDPTLLLDRRDYLSLLPGGMSAETEKCGVAYFLDPTPFKRQLMETAGEKMKMPVHDFLQAKNIEETGPERIEECIFPKVEDFLALYNKASFIVSDSFHGIVFAIIFRKPFLAVLNSARGRGRFYSLLSLFHLENRLIEEGTEEIPWKLLKEFPADETEAVLRVRREESIAFLEKNCHA